MIGECKIPVFVMPVLHFLTCAIPNLCFQSHNLQDSHEREYINCDRYFQQVRIMSTQNSVTTDSLFTQCTGVDLRIIDFYLFSSIFLVSVFICCFLAILAIQLKYSDLQQGFITVVL